MSDRSPPHQNMENDWRLLKRTLPYLLKKKSLVWVVALATPAGVLGALVQPILLKEGIDGAISNADPARLLDITLLFLGAVISAFLMRSLGLYALQIIGLRALEALRRDIFRHVMAQGLRFFDRRTTGSLMTRTTNDVEAVYESITFGAVGIITDGLTIVGTVAFMFSLDWKLSLVAFSISPIIVLVVNIFRKRLRVLFTDIRKALSKLNGFFAEQIHGVEVLQLYGAEEQARREFRRQAYAYSQTYREANWWDAGLYAIIDGMSSLSVGLLLLFGASAFGQPEMGITLGLLVAFVEYLSKVFVPIREFSGRLATIQRAVAALERIFSLLDTHDEIETGHVEVKSLDGAITFKQVAFAYGPDRPEVLKDISFSVTPGDVVAIVGATGSGKSTIGRILLRLYDGYSGSIELDGVELSTLDAQSLRRQISVVNQDPYLFKASIRDNISLWSPDVSDEDCRHAARLARADDFIEARQKGYDHKLAERGGNLSVGEKQLLSIGRAMAREAPIVILDEATASVDSMTESLIDTAIETLLKDKTVLVIAHRLSTITRADRILVLHEGRVVEQGRHDELMARKGRYRLLVEAGFAL